MKEQLLYESTKSKVYLLPEGEAGAPVVMKVLNYEFPTPKDIARFYNEFEILEGLELPGVRKALLRTKVQNQHAVLLEWVDGLPLKTAWRNKHNDLIDFLHISGAIAGALNGIHQQGIIHKDISPFNILVNLQQRTVRIIDFGISSRIDVKLHHLGNPELLEGTLAYNSPEQTGRMNRVVDYRTDLYSLGATLYEMLTGQVPFSGKDVMELVHCHLAQVPRLVHELNPQVPAQLSAIIAKLLAKNAEDRYQSAFGLKTDLEQCLAQLESTGRIDAFPIAQRDFSGRFLLPQKLYGREQEVEALLEAFDRSAVGSLELVLVAGYSGTGKSALVHEVHKPITGRRGYFIEGKFDQFQRSVPYYAIVEAFKELVNVLLTENETQLGQFREQIQQALGAEGKVLTNVIPNLAHIIGEQPDVPELMGTEAQNRFNYMMRKFVQAVCTPAHPIVLFIDDLQWADSASLGLLHVLLTDPAGGHLLCIGAYRDNEVSPSHPFVITCNELRETGAKLSTIQIGNLSEANVHDLVVGALNARNADTAALTELVYAKTRGNAFFVTQFLKSIYEEKLLVFDFDTCRWTWNIAKIRERNITDNVVELMAEKILRLPVATQEAMKRGACIGNSFDFTTLTVICQLSEEQLRKDLHEGLREGLLVPLGDNKVKFSHDRIQQAVYSLIPDQQKNEVHLHIGKLLLSNTPAEKLDERIFDIVNQWNCGLGLLTQETEREQVAQLNLQAGQKAKQNSAFALSLEYLQTGIRLLRADAWHSQYELALPLHSEATEAAYLCGNFTEMDQLFRALLANARDMLEKVKPYEIRILAYKAENKLIEAINTGLEVLAQLGEDFPKKPNMAHVGVGLARTMLSLQGKTNDDLVALPVMQDPYKIAAMRILADITSSVYWAKPDLLPLIVFRMVKLSLKHGNTPVSAFAFGSYGVIMCGVLGFMKKGYDYGRLALMLLEKLNAKEWKAQIYVTTYALIMYWREHIKNTLHPLQESFHIGMETGAIEFACVNTNIYCIHSYLCGKPLVRLEEETRAYSQSFQQFKQETNFNYNEVYRQSMLNFLGKSESPVVLKGEAYNEEVMLPQNLARNDKTGTFFIHFNKLLLGYHFRDLKRARHHGAEARKLFDAVLAKFEVPNTHFYEALTLLALYPDAPQVEQSALLKQARKSMSTLKKWAKDAPENYLHKYQLIKAEELRVTGHFPDARLLYDQAISGASDQGYLHEEALASELAGRAYLEQNSANLAAYYLKAAYHTYREWGAEAKLRNLEQQFPKYVSAVTQGEGSVSHSRSVSATTSMVHGSVLDITTVLKASTTISGEVVLSKLLEVLMEIVIENAGAQRGFLLLEKEGALYIDAQQDAAADTAEVLQHLPLSGCGLLPETVVQYVKRTRENVVLQDAATDSRYKSDPYIAAHHPQSVLCLPIINQGKFIGVLYLENNLTTGAFTQSRINLLSLLSGQIAVSIDNAILYNSLEQKVEERTAQLAAEKQKSDDLLYNILPFETAQELKQKGYTDAQQFEQVTVLFTDFKGFTSIAEKLSPTELVQEINECFKAFDTIAGKYGIEKIKTIGDSYMAVGGLPVPNSTHAENVVRAALEMRDFITDRKARGEGPGFEVRIGVHSGPVVAGVVGTRKIQYDIWGDTVNTASRMESSGVPGKVNISHVTHALVKDKFSCSYRGEVEAKGKGKVEMYFVEGINGETAYLTDTKVTEGAVEEIVM